jgi:tRNA-splicing ligase RtcB
MDHPGLPHLIKLIGFIQGDGSLHFLKKGGSLLGFYADPEDLEAIRRSIRALGFISSRIYQRRRSHSIKTNYGTVEFEQTESFVHAGSTALAVLLRCLGTIDGNKAEQDFNMPAWLDHAPRWMRRLYLAGLFGAELTTPQTVTNHPYNFIGPALSMNKRESNVPSGRRYFEKVQAWLSEFGVESFFLKEREEYVNQDGRLSIRLRLQISSKPENLIRPWSIVGFEYNRRKTYLGCVAAQYLKLKSLVLEERANSIETAKALRARGLNPREVTYAIASVHVNERFVERSIWDHRVSQVRIGTAFPDFRTFLEEQTRGLGVTGQVWDTIICK